MDVQKAVIIVEHIIQISAWQIVGSLLNPGIISTGSVCKSMESYLTLLFITLLLAYYLHAMLVYVIIHLHSKLDNCSEKWHLNSTSWYICYWSIIRYHIPRSWLQATNNLLVIFEENGGNPFEISVKLRVPRILCAQVSESHYPRLQKWFHPDVIHGKVSISDMKPEIHLQCEEGHIISSIEFASYGTPHGSCQNFSEGNCHSQNSLSMVSKVYMFIYWKEGIYV